MFQIELKTAPADFRFPTTNQTRHCFTRYIEFHRCSSLMVQIGCRVYSLHGYLIGNYQLDDLMLAKYYLVEI